jgi:hypothetical protein
VLAAGFDVMASGLQSADDPLVVRFDDRDVARHWLRARHRNKVHLGTRALEPDRSLTDAGGCGDPGEPQQLVKPDASGDNLGLDLTVDVVDHPGQKFANSGNWSLPADLSAVEMDRMACRGSARAQIVRDPC